MQNAGFKHHEIVMPDAVCFCRTLGQDHDSFARSFSGHGWEGRGDFSRLGRERQNPQTHAGGWFFGQVAPDREQSASRHNTCLAAEQRSFVRDRAETSPAGKEDSH